MAVLHPPSEQRFFDETVSGMRTSNWKATTAGPTVKPAMPLFASGLLIDQSGPGSSCHPPSISQVRAGEKATATAAAVSSHSTPRFCVCRCPDRGAHQLRTRRRKDRPSIAGRAAFNRASTEPRQGRVLDEARLHIEELCGRCDCWQESESRQAGREDNGECLGPLARSSIRSLRRQQRRQRPFAILCTPEPPTHGPTFDAGVRRSCTVLTTTTARRGAARRRPRRPESR